MINFTKSPGCIYRLDKVCAYDTIFSPRRACTEKVTVVVSCVCVCVCLYVCMSVRTRYSGSTRGYKYNERCHRV